MESTGTSVGLSRHLWPVTAPTSDEYAVYSAFIDNVFTTEQPFRADQSISDSNLILVADEALPLGPNRSALPLDVVALGPEDMGKDFFRQNEQRWRLAEKLNSRIHTKLVNTALRREAARYGTEELIAPDGDDKKWLPHASPARLTAQHAATVIEVEQRDSLPPVEPDT